MFDSPEPMERLEEILFHPADKTFNCLHDKELAKKKELANERIELATLMGKLAKHPPKKGSEEHKEYEKTQEEIQILKEKISKNHDELMEILKNEEKISREMQKRRF